MLTKVTRRLSAEIALHRHNRQNRQGVVSDDAQRFHVLNDILPAPVYGGLLSSLADVPAVRSETSWRTGEAIGGHELGDSVLAPHLEYLLSNAFLNDVRQRADIPELQWVPGTG